MMTTMEVRAVLLPLGHLVKEPSPYLPVHWTPAEPPPCSQAVMARVLIGLRQLDGRRVPERR